MKKGPIFMTRGKPILFFNSNEHATGKEDQYVSSWINALEGHFNIIFEQEKYHVCFLNKIRSFTTKRSMHIMSYKTNAMAAFCFNSGSMCSKNIIDKLKKENIKTYAVIYGLNILDDMSNAIQLGYFDDVIISKFSNMEEKILKLNPSQKISKILDSFDINFSGEHEGVGVMSKKTTSNSHIVFSQIEIIKKYFNNIKIVRDDKYFLEKCLCGYIMLPQHFEDENMIKKMYALNCKKQKVFIPDECFMNFKFGIPYKNIKDLTINISSSQSECFSKSKFISNLISIMHRS